MPMHIFKCRITTDNFAEHFASGDGFLQGEGTEFEVTPLTKMHHFDVKNNKFLESRHTCV